ncbi:hypothetical protein TW95_gp1015 [Pandoravirus inopinatum]|uniref:Uncharacterized protein n=1 Tax=Pandoravirus inopinatum TaxID=1605721 RepID=A0A0B5J2H3_9VIRU|nr:hypothetical protein TW95_gp1015 [Pandoravirus inopinatum]AJF97749.1 hypothetical protein [Pandoravirus inopinatum]
MPPTHTICQCLFFSFEKWVYGKKCSLFWSHLKKKERKRGRKKEGFFMHLPVDRRAAFVVGFVALANNRQRAHPSRLSWASAIQRPHGSPQDGLHALADIRLCASKKTKHAHSAHDKIFLICHFFSLSPPFSKSPKRILCMTRCARARPYWRYEKKGDAPNKLHTKIDTRRTKQRKKGRSMAIFLRATQ